MAKPTAEAKQWTEDLTRRVCEEEANKLAIHFLGGSQSVQFAMANDIEVFQAVCDLRVVLNEATAKYR